MNKSGLFLVRAVPLVCGVLLPSYSCAAIHIEPKPAGLIGSLNGQNLEEQAS
jgi:hypothetical protein